MCFRQQHIGSQGCTENVHVNLSKRRIFVCTRASALVVGYTVLVHKAACRTSIYIFPKEGFLCVDFQAAQEIAENIQSNRSLPKKRLEIAKSNDE